MRVRAFFAWVIGFVIAAAICYWPGSLALFVVAMWGGFSPNVGIALKVLVVAATLTVIVATIFFLARSIARTLIEKWA